MGARGRPVPSGPSRPTSWLSHARFPPPAVRASTGGHCPSPAPRRGEGALGQCREQPRPPRPRARWDEMAAEKARPEVTGTTAPTGHCEVPAALSAPTLPAPPALRQAPGPQSSGLTAPLHATASPPPTSQHQAPRGLAGACSAPIHSPVCCGHQTPPPRRAPGALECCSASSPLPTRSHVRCWAGAAMPKLSSPGPKRSTGCRPPGPRGPDRWATAGSLIGGLSWPRGTRAAVPAPAHRAGRGPDGRPRGQLGRAGSAS